MSRYRMNVCTSLNDNYAKYTIVMLKSLFENNPEAEAYVYLLQDFLSEFSIRQLRDLCDSYENHLFLLHVDTDRIDKRILTTDCWRLEASFRLQMLDLLPKEIDRVLYLDVDIIINHSLEELYRMDFHGCDLIAARDMPLTEDKKEDYRFFRPEVFYPLIDEEKYFNSGMVLFDVQKLREEGICLENYLDLALDLDFQIFAPDQDLLNLMHTGNTIIVDPWKYNFHANIGVDRGYDYEKVKKEVSVVHFVEKKPWQTGNHMNFPIEKLWWDYSLKTVYKDVFLSEFVMQAVSDMSMRDYIKSLLEEIGILKENLKKTVDAFHSVTEAYRNLERQVMNSQQI